MRTARPTSDLSHSSRSPPSACASASLEKGDEAASVDTLKAARMRDLAADVDAMWTADRVGTGLAT